MLLARMKLRTAMDRCCASSLRFLGASCTCSSVHGDSQNTSKSLRPDVLTRPNTARAYRMSFAIMPPCTYFSILSISRDGIALMRYKTPLACRPLNATYPAPPSSSAIRPVSASKQLMFQQAAAGIYARKRRCVRIMSLLQRVSNICSGSGSSSGSGSGEAGCRVVQHSDGSVHVMNCPYWSPRDSTMLQYDCPGAVISVQSSVSSLSGFVVVIRNPVVACVGGGRLIMACMAAAIVFACIWVGLRAASDECARPFPFNASIAQQWWTLPKNFFLHFVRL
jgi:hypothetical protein